MRIETIQAFIRDAGKLVQDIHTDKAALIVDDQGVPAAYLVDAKTYEATNQKLKMLEAITAGEADIAAGRTLTHEQAKVKLAQWLT